MPVTVASRRLEMRSLVFLLPFEVKDTLFQKLLTILSRKSATVITVNSICNSEERGQTNKQVPFVH